MDMNKQNLRPCMGGWLLIASGAITQEEYDALKKRLLN